MSILRGYEPVTKIDTNVVASRKALSSMNFPKVEIDKLEVGLKARNKVLKSTRTANSNIQKLLKGEGREHPILPEPIICDICGESKSIGIAKLTSPEQSVKIPSGWIIVNFDPSSKEIVYAVVPPGVVIDYSRGKVYIVCGTCQIILGLKPTESGLLINEIRDGHGYVDLDSIDKLINI